MGHPEDAAVRLSPFTPEALRRIHSRRSKSCSTGQKEHWRKIRRLGFFRMKIRKMEGDIHDTVVTRSTRAVVKPIDMDKVTAALKKRGLL